MKKIIITLAFVATSGLGFAQTPANTVAAPTAPPLGTGTTVATATVTCSPEKGANASSSGSGSIAIARCGDRPAVPALKKVAVPTASAASGANPNRAEFLALLRERDELKAASVAKTQQSAAGDKLADCGTQSRIVYIGNDGMMYATCKGTSDEIFRAPPPAAPQVIVVNPANVHQLGGQAVQQSQPPVQQPGPVGQAPSNEGGCKVVVNGKVVIDFIANGQVAAQGEGPKCAALRADFAQKNPQYNIR